MRPRISVAVPDPLVARDLETALARHRPVVVERGGQWCVAVEEGSGATLTQVLSTIDAWLAQSGLGRTRVVVGERAGEAR